MPDQQPTNEPVIPIGEGTNIPPLASEAELDSLHVKPVETKFQLKIHHILAIIGALILIAILIYGFVFAAI